MALALILMMVGIGTELVAIILMGTVMAHPHAGGSVPVGPVALLVVGLCIALAGVVVRIAARRAGKS
jgi:hypothetical protein